MNMGRSLSDVDLEIHFYITGGLTAKNAPALTWKITDENCHMVAGDAERLQIPNNGAIQIALGVD